MTEGIKGRSALAIVLAAGEGTRMKSAVPKVLHAVAGRSLVGHVLAATQAAGVAHLAVVIGPDRDDVAQDVRRIAPDAGIFVQSERLGTAHAVLAARAALAKPVDDVIILFGDTPLVSPDTVLAMRRALADGAAVVGVGFEAKDPTGYGRFIMQDGQLTDIREHKDASAAERAITFCNGGLMAMAGSVALDLLNGIGNANAQKEYYLTDAPALARRKGLRVAAIATSEDDVRGVNDRVQLAAAEALMQQRLREAAMRNGATMIAPDTVYLCHDTVIGRDVMIEPHVVFGAGVTVADRAVIHAFSHLEGAAVAEGASIGPYARLRPGAQIGAKAKIGNFVEV
ncbi:MAG: NTP transferase domain-containing protein, partial [Beijerinckiaceae bacterium]